MARLLTTAAAAERLGVHPNTLRKWSDRGLIPHTKLPSGFRRYTDAEIAAFAQSLRVEEGTLMDVAGTPDDESAGPQERR